MTVWLEATCGHELEWPHGPITVSDSVPPFEWDCPEHGRVGFWAQRANPSPENLPPMPVGERQET